MHLSCVRCRLAFNVASRMSVRSMATQASSKKLHVVPKICAYCFKRFANNSALIIHRTQVCSSSPELIRDMPNIYTDSLTEENTTSDTHTSESSMSSERSSNIDPRMSIRRTFRPLPGVLRSKSGGPLPGEPTLTNVDTSEGGVHSSLDADSSGRGEKEQCPVCSEWFVKGDLQRHIATMPVEHQKPEGFRNEFISSRADLQKSLDRFSRPQVVAKGAAHHTTTYAMRNTIQMEGVVRGSPASAAEDVVGALAAEHAPKAVYFAVTPDESKSGLIPRVSYFPLWAEPAEELSTVVFDLNKLVDRGYLMYLAGIQISTFGPRHRSRVTAMILMCTRDQEGELHGEFRARLLALDPEDNPVLSRAASPEGEEASVSATNGVESSCGKRLWTVATRFQTRPSASSSVTDSNVDTGRTAASSPFSAESERPVRIVVALAGDASLKELEPRFQQSFRVQQAGVSNQHVCPICESSVSNLLEHIQNRHEGAGAHVCEKCGKRYASKGMLNLHIKAVHDGEVFRCDEPQCGFETRYKALLKRHRVAQHEVSRCEEPQSGFETGYKALLKRHRVAQHEGVKHLCRIRGCGYVTTYKWNLRKHVERYHGRDM